MHSVVVCLNMCSSSEVFDDGSKIILLKISRILVITKEDTIQNEILVLVMQIGNVLV